MKKWWNKFRCRLFGHPWNLELDPETGDSEMCCTRCDYKTQPFLW